ncbi:MAG: hypothetical protein JWM59_4890 [Verrucomicrobiales bacterium]|nr:hypothetical protein [Verrucomicrobiales bacterium]
MSSRNLAYTIAFDPPGDARHRALAKMLTSSLLKTYFDGDILVFRNTEAPLFLVERKGLEEIYIETPEVPEAGWADLAMRWKYLAADRIETGRYDKILFLDCDCLALRNIDHLLQGEWDIACQPEKGISISCPQFSAFLTDGEMGEWRRDGINSGTWAVRGSKFHEVMRQWARIDSSLALRGRRASDQPAWNRLLLDTDLRVESFPDGEIQFPMFQHPRFPAYHKAALTHNLGGTLTEKVHFTFGLYMQSFYCDPSALFLQFLDV